MSKRALLLGGLTLIVVALAPAALAGWSSSLTAGPLPVTSNTLAAPVQNNPSCANGTAAIKWTITASAWADGYDIARSTTNGGPYTILVHIGNRAIVTYNDSTVDGSSIYYYVIRSSKSTNWRSGNSNQKSVDSSNC